MITFQEHIEPDKIFDMAICIDDRPIHAVKMKISGNIPTDAEREECKNFLVNWHDKQTN